MEQPRILMTDHEADLRNLMKAALKKEGFSEIETVGSVVKGLRAFEQFSLTEKAMIYVKKFRKTSHMPCCFYPQSPMRSTKF